MANIENGDVTPKRPWLAPKWKPGESANPAGRPRGSRSKLSEKFLKDLHDSWEKIGVSAIERMARDAPGDYVRVVASLVPRELLVTTGSMDEITDVELLDAISSLRSLLTATPASPAPQGRKRIAAPAGKTIDGRVVK